jgi:muramoyltetrapeptide carboxypeptidase LdcA involved in peptidoglycan recycling
MIIPQKLQKGDEIRVIAPSSSFSFLSTKTIELAVDNLKKQGFKVTFSKNCSVSADLFASSSINQRVEDIHQAFFDTSVKAIFTAIGGFNSNQLLDHLDYNLIKNNPKILCGYSDITALQNAITTKTGLLTYSGPHFSTWGMKKEFEYNLKCFNQCLVLSDDFNILPSRTWSDDQWFIDQNNRTLIKNNGFIVLNKGKADGLIYGGNLCTFNLLQGTQYMPDISDAIIFIEDDAIVGGATGSEFDRNLQSLIHQPQFNRVKGLVIGRFQKKSEMSLEKLKRIIETKSVLKNIPVIANVDFGHTNPLITFPIGGTVKIEAKDTAILRVLKH